MSDKLITLDNLSEFKTKYDDKLTNELKYDDDKTIKEKVQELSDILDNLDNADVETY